MNRGRSIAIAAITSLAVLLIGLPALVSLITDWYWFEALGFTVVFWTSFWARIGVGLSAGIVCFAFIYVNLRVAQRGIVPELSTIRGPGTTQLDLNALMRRLSVPIAAAVSFLVGISATSWTFDLLRFVHRSTFGSTDPVFGKDIGYYFFSLPMFSIGIGFFISLTIFSLILVVPIYVLRRDVALRGRGVMVEASAGTHLALLLALLFVTIALQTWFVSIPSLLYSTTGPLFGASHTDLVARVPLLKASALVALIAAGAVLVGARRGNLGRMAVISGLLYLLVAGVLARGVPALYQRLVVAPNELNKETPQLVHHIAATQQAWGFDAVATRELTGEATLTLADIETNRGTIENVRLWDRDPLLQTFRQLQEIRTYYDFVSVDDDRYWIDGSYRQVLLSPRELNAQSLPQRTFINERLTFTHGMGLTLSPVNQVTQEGLPVLFIKDLPPASRVSLQITRPGIYYGELSSGHVFVNTQQPEFDYPSGEGNVVTTYDGTGGVPTASLWRRLLLSIRFGSLKILLSTDITNDSRVMFHRNIVERTRKALPFLELDSDPYMIITEAGHLKWIIDAYTLSDRYPYAQPLRNGTNYLRNSVKVVLDAYDGTVEAYVSEPDDPIIQTYQKIFPGILKPLSEMPADVRAHIRYPEDLFRVQTALYTIYHMREPDVLYHREDQWQIPAASTRGEGNRDPFLRHIIMKLPGETQEEFIVMTPFTPRQKDNLAAWMVGRSDGDNYGQLVVYRFPRQSLVFGPSQVANRINQNTEISRQISLWDQRGSQVIFGNLLVIPIEEALIFVQAIYLRAEGGRIPELKRVVVAYQNQVVMEETLQRGLDRLFGTAVTAAPERVVDQPAAFTPTPETSTRAQLIQEASDHYDRAVAAQRAGDWATYGAALEALGSAIEQLRQAAEENP